MNWDSFDKSPDDERPRISAVSIAVLCTNQTPRLRLRRKSEGRATHKGSWPARAGLCGGRRTERVGIRQRPPRLRNPAVFAMYQRRRSAELVLRSVTRCQQPAIRAPPQLELALRFGGQHGLDNLQVGHSSGVIASPHWSCSP